ncbi:MAG: efflux transporter outer membrane subunit [Pseudomonadota bacterium]
MSGARLAALTGSVMLAACVVGPDYEGPPTPPPAIGGEFALSEAAPVAAADPVTRWWQQLDDPVLNELIADTLLQNYELAAAEANIRASRALLRLAKQEFFPTGSVTAAYARERISLAAQQFAGGLEVPELDPEQDQFNLGADASWEIDLFGRLRRNAEAARADLGESMALRNDLVVTLAAETANAYIDLRGAQARLRVAESNADNQRRTYELTEILLRGGRGTGLDVARAKSQLDTTLATIPPLQVDVDVAISRLSVLGGRGPGALRERLLPASKLPDLPATVAIGSPDQLLRRRPDIRAAERSLAAATATIGIETAELFPRVSILGNIGYTALDFDQIGTGDAFRYSIGPSISWRLFDYGRIFARIAAADARAEGAVATYQDTVLRALEETEVALTSYGNERVRRDRLETANAASQEAARLARLRYQSGIDDFLTVLDAERVALENEDLLVLSRIEANLQLVALYKALGGGWEVVAPGVENIAYQAADTPADPQP